MTSCDRFQTQLLEHLYGLLEAEESLALIEHAGQCDECRAALQRADAGRKLMAFAAKSSFPNVRFQKPAVVEPAVIPMPKRRTATRRARMPRLYRGLGVAAAVLFCVAAVTFPIARYLNNYGDRRDEVNVAAANLDKKAAEERDLINVREAERQRAMQARRDAENRLKKIEAEQGREMAEAADEARRQQMYLVVVGHDSIRPGLPNDYRIETKNLMDEKVKARLDIRVRDLVNNQVVMEQKDVRSEGNYVLSLPADVPLKASNQLALEVAARSESGPQKGALTEKLSLARSVFVTQLVTDKPMYQPGETVRFRSLTLDRYTLKPAGEDFRLVYSVENSQGKKVALFDEGEAADGNKQALMVKAPRLINAATGGGINGPDKQPLRGIGAGEFQIPTDVDGGEYTLIVEDAGKKFPPERRKFLINVYQKPRLNKELNFGPSSFGPGQDVTAIAKVSRAEGGLPLVAQPAIATIRIDGKTYKANGQVAGDNEDAGIHLQTSPLGEVNVRFKLPAQIERGEASLSIQFSDGGNFESIVRTIPIALKKLQIEFFPEGGELVAGVPNRVYFSARTTLDKPADVKGVIVDRTGKVVAQAETLNDDRAKGISQGMGVFTLTPVVGEQYELKVRAPEKIEGKYALPNVANEGVVLSVPTGVTTDQDSMTAVITSARKDRELLVGAYCRGALLAFQTVKVRADQTARIQLKPTGGIGGVYRVTVFEKGAQLKPLAERLVYRMPSGKLNVSVRADKSLYAPGEKVTLHLNSHNETGQPMPTVLLVGVVDKSVLTMADEKTARSLPTHFLLTSEVRRAEDLEFADVLLGDHPKAAAALDLLLGTQGWRRFLESDPKRFEEENKTSKRFEDMRAKADVERLRVISGKMSGGQDDEQRAISTLQLKRDRVVAKFKPEFEQIEAQINDADNSLAIANDPVLFEQRKIDLKTKAEEARTAYVASYGKLRGYDDFNDLMRGRLLLLFGILLLAAGIVSLVVGFRRTLRRALPIYAASLATVGLCAVAIVGTFVLDAKSPSESPLSASAKPSKTAGWAQDDATRAALGEAPDMDRAEGRRELAAADEKKNNGRRKGGADGADGGGGGGDPRQQAEGGKNDKPDVKREPVPGMAPAHKPADNNNKLQPMEQRPGFGQQKDQNRDYRAGQPAAPPGAAARARQTPPGERKVAATMAPTNGPNRGQGQAGEPGKDRGPNLGGVPEDGRFAGRNLQNEALQRTDALKKLKEQLEKQNKGEGAKEMDKLAQKFLRENEQSGAVAQAEPCYIREFAHQYRTSSGSELRSDFAETLYWHPALVLADGKVDISFNLCDSVTTFQVLAAAHTPDGRLASVTTDLEVRKPFTIEAKVPAQVTANDTLDIPVAIANDSADARRLHLSVSMTNLELTGSGPHAAQRELVVAPQQRTRVLFQLKPKVREGTGTLTIRASSEPFGTDAVQYSLKIVPEGFATAESHSDLLEGNAHFDVNLPKDWVRPTLKAELSLYPSALADLQKGLEGLLREPHGCFEQTSTSNYPNLLILQYLRDTNQDNPEVAARARQLLDRGYGKLTAFECQKPGAGKQGYEWFGGAAPAHEALTAYGLMQFRDMLSVGQTVDPAMVERTRQYLLSRKDGKGGFQRNPRALDTFGRAPENITNAYIVWAITEGDKDGRDDIARELDALAAQAKDSKDPYFLALVANSLLNRGQNAPAEELLKKIAELQKPDGSIPGAGTSITGSGGRDLIIETTALVVLAWQKANRPEHFKNIGSAVKWIGQQRGGYGGFGSTQSTILALKALIAFTKANSKPLEPGAVTLVVNGKPIATRAFTADLREALTIAVDNAEQVFKPGKNDVQISVTGKNVLPYSLSWTYSALTPKSPESCPVRLSASLAKQSVQDGSTVPLNIKVENTTDKGQGMAVAIVGLPAGLNLPPDMEQLKTLARLRNDGTEPGTISAWELRGRELVLYWRQLKPNQKIEFNLDLECRVPGDYRGPAGRAYLYYNADHKHWIDPIQVNVTPK